jgi:hypothetical protein
MSSHSRQYSVGNDRAPVKITRNTIKSYEKADKLLYDLLKIINNGIDIIS